jgi:hypothetical protein
LNGAKVVDVQHKDAEEGDAAEYVDTGKSVREFYWGRGCGGAGELFVWGRCDLFWECF